MKLLSSLGLSILLICSARVLAAELHLLTEEFRPLSYTENGKLTGMAVELVELLLKRADVPAQMELVPWTRGYYRLQHESGLALFPVARTPRREQMFGWVGPIVVSRTGVYTKRDSGLTLRNLADLDRQGTTAVPKQWYTYEYLKDQGLKKLYTVPTPDHVVRMFKHGRISVLVSTDMSLKSMLAKQGMSQDEVMLQFYLQDTFTYIAFSPDTDPKLLQRLQKELDQINREGTLEQIHRRWFDEPYRVPLAKGE
jgi:polar amino acid transport system substrate-binding protein